MQTSGLQCRGRSFLSTHSSYVPPLVLRRQRPETTVGGTYPRRDETKRSIVFEQELMTAILYKKEDAIAADQRSDALMMATSIKLRLASVILMATFFLFGSVLMPLRQWRTLDLTIETRNTSRPKLRYGPLPPPSLASASNETLTNIRIGNLKEASRTNFSGILARSFDSWRPDMLPCYPSEPDWDSMDVQNSPCTEGFLFVKPFKTGSSTVSGVNLRIARGVARRRKDKSFEMCKSRFDHGPNRYPGMTLFKERDHKRSFLWTVIREPTKRATSEYFHFFVSRKKQEPSDSSFQEFLQERRRLQDYYYRALSTSYFNRTSHDAVVTGNEIMLEYDFIGVTERMDESLVALMMLLKLQINDILYLSAKGKGGYDAGGGSEQKCTYIWPSFVTPGMDEYFHGDEWGDMIKNDVILYNTVNRSLDLTIEKLGHDAFANNLKLFKATREKASIDCLPATVFPCDIGGVHHKDTDCIWKDSGCGASCLDGVNENKIV